MHSDSRQADFCAYLSVILLAGLLLNALFGWWWADAVTALTMVPIIAHEGVKGLRGQACDDCGAGGTIVRAKRGDSCPRRSDFRYPEGILNRD